jgi:hypothetical protein
LKQKLLLHQMLALPQVQKLRLMFQQFHHQYLV